MRGRFIAIGLLLLPATALAQSDTLPSASSTSGVSIGAPGRPMKPAELTPTGPRTVRDLIPPPPVDDPHFGPRRR